MLKKNLAISIAKLAKASIKLLNMGSGSTLPGRLALMIEPNILEEFDKEISKLSEGSSKEAIKINITGTNGKTTTTGLLRSIIKEHLQGSSDKKPNLVSNEMGANLYTGVCSAFIEQTSFANRLEARDYLLEVDEASLPKIASILDPSIITTTNLYRDQLDRFGELDTTQKLINSGIDKAKNPILVLNSDHSHVRTLGQDHHKKIFYSVDISEELKKQKAEKLKDLITNLESQMANTGNTEGKVQNLVSELKATVLEEGFDYSKIRLSHGKESIEITVNLPGLYNVYNATAAAATALALEHVESKGSQARKVSLTEIKTGIENYSTNFGRAEEKLISGVKTQTFLIKNPTGATEVLKHLGSDPDARFMIALNDNYADGRDVSWIWDAEFEHLANHTDTIIVSGKRAQDMGTRLKYAGLEKSKIESIEDIKVALEKSLEQCGPSKKLYILPTYTALLELEKIKI